MDPVRKPADADPEALEIKLIPAPEMVVDKTLVDSRLADIVGFPNSSIAASRIFCLVSFDLSS